MIGLSFLEVKECYNNNILTMCGVEWNNTNGISCIQIPIIEKCANSLAWLDCVIEFKYIFFKV